MSVPELNARLAFARGDFRLRMDWQSHGAQRIGIFGASGAGKSTLLHLLAGLLRPDTGELRFGTDRWFARGAPWVPPERRDVGYVFQDARVFPHLSVAQNLAYGNRRGRHAPGARSDQQGNRSDRVCQALGLTDLLTARGAALSGGQQKRVAIARALLPQPRLILCDEAEAGLDATSRAGFGALLNEALANGALILRVSHDLADLLAWSDRLLFCHAGELVFAGLPGDLPHSSRAASVLHGGAGLAGAPWLPLRIGAKLWLRSERLHWLPRLVVADAGQADHAGSFARMIPARVQAKDASWLQLELQPGGEQETESGPVALRVPLTAIPAAVAWSPGDELWCAVPADALVREQ